LQARRCGGKKYDIIGLFQMRNGTAVTFHPFIKITCLFEALLNSAIFTISSGITCRETAGGREAAPRALVTLSILMIISRGLSSCSARVLGVFLVLSLVFSTLYSCF
jgi:hypothetical protein